jgi:hypothetical protein
MARFHQGWLFSGTYSPDSFSISIASNSDWKSISLKGATLDLRNILKKMYSPAVVNIYQIRIRGCIPAKMAIFR